MKATIFAAGVCLLVANVCACGGVETVAAAPDAAPTCDGCIDGHGVCQHGTIPPACGKGGAACVDCPTGGECHTAVCTLGECKIGNKDQGSPCGAGTCDGKGSCCMGCVLYDSVTDSLQCVASCPTGAMCSNGTCVYGL